MKWTSIEKKYAAQRIVEDMKQYDLTIYDIIREMPEILDIIIYGRKDLEAVAEDMFPYDEIVDEVVIKRIIDKAMDDMRTDFKIYQSEEDIEVNADIIRDALEKAGNDFGYTND